MNDNESTDISSFIVGGFTQPSTIPTYSYYVGFLIVLLILFIVFRRGTHVEKLDDFYDIPDFVNRHK